MKYAHFMSRLRVRQYMNLNTFNNWAALVRKKHEIEAELLIAERLLELGEVAESATLPEDLIDVEFGVEPSTMNQKDVCAYLDMDAKTLRKLIQQKHVPEGRREGKCLVWDEVTIRAKKIELEKKEIWPR